MSNKNQTIPVVFAVNNNYAPYLYVCFKSLIKNAKIDVNYNLYVLYTGLEKRHIKNFIDLTGGNIRVECINVEKYMEGINISGSVHLTVETCYRMLIPEIFLEYPKVLYIDSDTLVLDDVFDLYSYSLQGKTVGVVHDVVCEYLKEYFEQRLGMDVCDAFNAGVMLIDTAKFREKKIKDKCMRMLEEDSKADERRYIYMDQDVLNLVLKDDKCFLDAEWNVQWQYLWRLDIVDPEYRKHYVTYLNNAKILHYAGDKKPWQHPELEIANKFWEFARESIYYEEILFNNLSEFIRKKEEDLFAGYLFPFSKIQRNSKIILYGAGKVGKILYTQNKYTEYCKIMMWVDKNYKNLNDKIDAVYGIDDLKTYPENTYDYILVAIDDENICRDVEAELVNLGIKKEKIVWDKYRRD